MAPNPLRLLLLLAALLLAGCSDAPDAPLGVGANIWPGYEPLYLARERGYLDRNAIHPVEYLSASQVQRALANGTIDVAALTLDEALRAATEIPELRVFLVADISAGGDAIIARPEVESLENLAGRRVAVEDTALGAYFLALALERAGLKPTEVEKIPLRVNEHEAAFRQGTVEAAVTFEPVRSRLIHAGGQVLFDSRQTPDRIVDVLVTRESVLQERGAAIADLVAAWFRARADLLDPDDEAAREFAARREGVEPEDIARALEGLEFPDRTANRRLLAGPEPALADSCRKMADFLGTNDLLSTETVCHRDPAAFLTGGPVSASVEAGP
ncbi:NitT/TauT family transport system substrate-binding protein [Thiohalospira halophila DSM 15071]|uniref:NitT/TauT family transport system substrate-binding protein n=1 Tax=Thiohalospira halophila DSM 15071 TaxID=1123397 RepID=A0A1I1QBL4_9GAMM|nr:ABC transporter substrate-binding protein [Thiohalospira halophila]SFD19352.1 NitT/TauT family transport system substrate-binding protein [Thiohalospira halophila DSM 15071]